MRTPPTILALLLAVGLAHAQEPAGEPAPDARIDLRVLVTGVPGSERLDHFRAFLEEEFVGVGTANYSEFTAADAEGYDVVVIDAEITPTPNAIGLPPRPSLSRDYDRATVLVSGPGAILARPLGLKTDWG